ncbi:O-antigen ligase family protein, partial [Flavobacteriaceae bacterium]|nr:O-antigen ligase family protein [Flavobacteriaceae bacterium]
MITYFIPNFYSIDRIGNQWFYLSIICFFSFIFIVTDANLYPYIKSIIFDKTNVFYLIFIIWGLLSITYSFNKPEAIVTINQYFTVFAGFITFKILLKNISDGTRFILKLLLILLFLEVALSLIPILNDLEKGTLEYRSFAYSGAAANVNITAFSILYKTPILLYFFSTEKRMFLKFICLFVYSSIFFIISILGTRGAYIGLGICLLSYGLYLFKSEEKIINKLKNFAFIILLSLITFSINLVISKKGTDIISRASTIRLDTNDGSVNQRLRYYQQGLNHFLENPLIGVGIGNWKLFSIKYDKRDIDGYIVPYHAHNDFIQLLVELGFFGLLFYSLFIFFSVRKLFLTNLFNDKINFLFMGIAAIYLLDSLLNFPIARP